VLWVVFLRSVRDMDGGGGGRSLAKTKFGLGSNMVGENQCHEDRHRNECLVLGQAGSFGTMPEPYYFHPSLVGQPYGDIKHHVPICCPYS